MAYLGYVLMVAGLMLAIRTFVRSRTMAVEDHRPEAARRIDRYIALGASLLLFSTGLYLGVFRSTAGQPAGEGTSVPSTAPVTATPSVAATGEMLQYWTDESRAALRQQCLENGKRTAERYPELVEDYCKCATEKITLAYTPASYQELMIKPVEEQKAAIGPVVESCVAIMNKLIELSNEAQPQRPPKQQ
ncbi:MAG: hypothetical protein IT266_07355 [Saprospiraceae bacterium]|nr:hypothetical protein [Saprospiraceae bacterium]